MSFEILKKMVFCESILNLPDKWKLLTYAFNTYESIEMKPCSYTILSISV